MILPGDIMGGASVGGRKRRNPWAGVGVVDWGGGRSNGGDSAEGKDLNPAAGGGGGEGRSGDVKGLKRTKGGVQAAALLGSLASSGDSIGTAADAAAASGDSGGSADSTADSAAIDRTAADVVANEANGDSSIHTSSASVLATAPACAAAKVGNAAVLSAASIHLTCAASGNGNDGGRTRAPTLADDELPNCGTVLVEGGARGSGVEGAAISTSFGPVTPGNDLCIGITSASAVSKDGNSGPGPSALEQGAFVSTVRTTTSNTGLKVVLRKS